MTRGARLRARRDFLGLSLEEVSMRTRIPLVHLAALEEDRQADLPAGPYADRYTQMLEEVYGLPPEPPGTEHRRGLRFSLNGTVPGHLLVSNLCRSNLSILSTSSQNGVKPRGSQRTFLIFGSLRSAHLASELYAHLLSTIRLPQFRVRIHQTGTMLSITWLG